MHTTISEIAQIGYLGILMALVQLYLELNLPVTEAILAAEADLVTWKTVNSCLSDSESTLSTGG